MKSKKDMGTIPSADRGSVTTGDKRAAPVAGETHRNHAFLKSVDEYGRLSLMRAYDGWPRSGFDRLGTEIEVRRVSGDHGDEVQINITITKIKNDREYKSHGDMVLRGDDIALLIDHLQRDASTFATKSGRPRDDGTAIEPGHEPGA